MKFHERLRKKRLEAGLTQEQLAKATGLTTRSIQNYETGFRRPRYERIIEKLAEALGCTCEDLLGHGGEYIMAAQELGGAGDAKTMEELVDGVVGLFAGGELDEESLDGVYHALSMAYWDAKEKNKKYTPKKYRKKKAE